MTQLLYNISITMLSIGIIILTIYITRANLVNYLTTDQIHARYLESIKPKVVKDIFNYRVSKEYKKMFSEQPIWLGYQEFDPNEPVNKIYIK